LIGHIIWNIDVEVGSGGIMPNHAPLIVTEFGTFTFFPNRIDLGLDVLRNRSIYGSSLSDKYGAGIPSNVEELQPYFFLGNQKDVFALFQVKD
jgi:hypothetical protein